MIIFEFVSLVNFFIFSFDSSNNFFSNNSFSFACSNLFSFFFILLLRYKTFKSFSNSKCSVINEFILAVKNGLDSDTYALSEKCCIKSLGMQKIFTQRVLPLGLVLYMPASIVGMISFVIFAAMRSGVAITPVWILTAIVFALILLVAAPPIPGVNLLSYVVIIGQLGIGKEYVIAAIIFDMLFGAFGNAANQLMLQLDMILQAEHMGLLNRVVLIRDTNAQKS